MVCVNIQTTKIGNYTLILKDFKINLKGVSLIYQAR
jgi:hypothetical protein